MAVVVLALAVVGAAIVNHAGGGSPGTAPPAKQAARAAETSTCTAEPTGTDQSDASTTASSTTASGATVPLLSTVDSSSDPAAIVALQTRLGALGYWLGAADGTYGDGTAHAVIALQKTAGLPRTGAVDAATAQALADGTVPQPHSRSGLVVEINRSQQLMILVQDGTLLDVFDTSTGRPGLETPLGSYPIYAAVDTPDDGQGEYRPMFFYEPLALAIHGYLTVPPTPYSHGCARVTYAAMDLLWERGVGVGTEVLVYE